MSIHTVPPFTPAPECWTPVRDICNSPSSGGAGVCSFHLTSPSCGGGSGHCYPRGSETAARACPSGWTTADANSAVDEGTTQHSITCCPGTYGAWTIDSQATDLCSLQLRGGSIVVQVNDATERCDENEYIETLVWESGSDAVWTWVDGSPGTITSATGPLVVAVQANVIKLSWKDVLEPTTTPVSSSRENPAQGSTSTPTQLGPTTTSSALDSPGNGTAPASPSGLSQGAKAGIGVGVTIAAIFAAGLMLWALRKYRARQQVSNSGLIPTKHVYIPTDHDTISNEPGQRHELYDNYFPYRRERNLP